MDTTLVNDRGFLDINPLQCGREQCEPGYHYGPAIRTYYLIHYVLKGKGTFCFDGQKYELSKGQFFFIRPGQVTYYEADSVNPWEYLWIGFNGQAASVFDALDSPVGILPEVLFREVREMMRHNFEGWNNMIEEYLVCVIYRIAAELFGSRRPVNDYAARAHTYLSTMYMQHVSIDEIASLLSVDRRYLSRLFKDRYGQTMQEYLLALRLDHAALLLSEGYSVLESASLCGYEDRSNFSKMFSRRFGVSPNEYRKK